MERDSKQVNWLPFLSICSVFIVLGTVGWMLEIDTTPLAIGLGVMGGLIVIAEFFPPEFNLRNYWYTNITPEAHITLIASLLYALFF